MPRIATQIAETFLPEIFRRRPLRSQQQPIIGNDLPEQGGFSGNMPRDNVLSPGGYNPALNDTPALGTHRVYTTGGYVSGGGGYRDVPNQPAPNVLASTPPAQDPADPMISRSGQVMDENAIRPARRVETDNRGRPSRNITLSGDDQTIDYANRVAQYEPQANNGGWWPKIRAALGGFAAGGPAGAAAGFGARALREKFEPKLADEEWKAREMRTTAPAMEAIRKDRQERRMEAKTDADIDLAKARTEALKNPRQNARIIQRKDGVYMLNGKTGKFEKVDEIPPEAGTASGTRYFKAGNGEVWKVDPANPEGVRVKNIPGSPGKDSGDVQFTNAQIQRAISEAQAEQKKIDDGLKNIPRTIQSTDILGNPRTIANPDYTYNMTRRRKLDDDIRTWRQKLKSPKTSTATTRASDPLGILDDNEDDEDQ